MARYSAVYVAMCNIQTHPSFGGRVWRWMGNGISHSENELRCRAPAARLTVSPQVVMRSANAFVATPLPPSSRRSRVGVGHTPRMRAQPLSRRALLPLLLAVPLPALADRTGRYSTKLTAKRRYAPRIISGATALFRDGPVDLTIVDDLVTAMALFGTTYFSEGNRISERERELMSDVELAKTALKTILLKRRRADVDGEQAALEALRSAVRDWISIAQFERIADVSLLDPIAL